MVMAMSLAHAYEKRLEFDDEDDVQPTAKPLISSKTTANTRGSFLGPHVQSRGLPSGNLSTPVAAP